MTGSEKRLVKFDHEHLIIVFFIGVYAGMMLIAVNVFKGTAPQPMLDFWSIMHFFGGFSLGYLFNIYRRWSVSTLIIVALIPQILWKIYEYITGYTLFMASMSNVFMDIVLGTVGVIVSTYVARFIFARTEALH